MRISLLAVSLVIGFQAVSFLHDAHQRFVYYNSVHQYAGMLNLDAKYLCNDILEEARIVIIALMLGSAVMLFTGEAVWPAFLAQLFWVGFESYLCCDRSLANLRNVAVQLLILYILGTNLSQGDGQQKGAQGDNRPKQGKSQIPAPQNIGKTEQPAKKAQQHERLTTNKNKQQKGKKTN